MKKLALYILSLGFLSSCEKMSNYDMPNLEQLSAEQKLKQKLLQGNLLPIRSLGQE